MAPIAIGLDAKPEDSTIGVTVLKANLPLPVEPRTTLPAQWMYDESIFELEKRAIFSKVYRMFHCPTARLTLVSRSGS